MGEALKMAFKAAELLQFCLSTNQNKSYFYLDT